MENETTKQKETLLKVYIGTISALFIFAVFVWNIASVLPHSKAVRHLFLDENNFTELIAVGFLVAAILLVLIELWRSRKTRVYSSCWWFFPIMIFLLICEETSFGRTYYKWYIQPQICGTKFDALHDALAIFPHCLPYLGISKLIFSLVAFVVIIGTITVLTYLAVKYSSVLISSFKNNPACLYLIFAFVLFWLGGGIELLSEFESLGIAKNTFLVFLEELFEMLAELTIFFAALAFSLKESHLQQENAL